jgi:hypothetical protein
MGFELKKGSRREFIKKSAATAGTVVLSRFTFGSAPKIWAKGPEKGENIKMAVSLMTASDGF